MLIYCKEKHIQGRWGHIHIFCWIAPENEAVKKFPAFHFQVLKVEIGEGSAVFPLWSITHTHTHTKDFSYGFFNVFLRHVTHLEECLPLSDHGGLCITFKVETQSRIWFIKPEMTNVSQREWCWHVDHRLDHWTHQEHFWKKPRSFQLVSELLTVAWRQKIHIWALKWSLRPE